MLDVLSNARNWNIAIRTVHLATMGILLGGHFFDQPKTELVPMLWACVASGGALVVSESGGHLLWFHQIRGLMTMAKLLLVGLVPWCWSARVPILLAVVVVGSVGSHMSARWRYYSVLYREVIKSGCGPGVRSSDS